jgi:hypothetical protein
MWLATSPSCAAPRLATSLGRALRAVTLQTKGAARRENMSSEGSSPTGNTGCLPNLTKLYCGRQSAERSIYAFNMSQHARSI